MSDCANGGRNVYAIPKPDEREIGVLYMHPTYSKRFYEELKAIEVYGVRFERVSHADAGGVAK
jgi:hypothetical protein